MIMFYMKEDHSLALMLLSWHLVFVMLLWSILDHFSDLLGPTCSSAEWNFIIFLPEISVAGSVGHWKIITWQRNSDTKVARCLIIVFNNHIWLWLTTIIFFSKQKEFRIPRLKDVAPHSSSLSIFETLYFLDVWWGKILTWKIMTKVIRISLICLFITFIEWLIQLTQSLSGS